MKRYLVEDINCLED